MCILRKASRAAIEENAVAATIERAIPAKAIDDKLAQSPSMGGIILFRLMLAAGLFYVAQHLASDLSVEQFTTFRPFLMLGPFSPELRPHLRPNRSRDA
jgi:hypothetical protein